MFVVVYAVGGLAALALCVAAFWPWEWPVRTAPTWAPVLVLGVCVALVGVTDPPELALVFAVWPAMVALFVLAVRLSAGRTDRRTDGRAEQSPDGDEVRRRGRGG